jgi:integrase
MKWENFTAGRVAAFKCASGKKQSIFWDGKTPGLGLRVTAAGAKSYIFETSLNGKTLRMTIGDVSTYSIDAAQREASHYKAQTNKGIDPRQVAADLVAADIAKAVAKDEAQAAHLQQVALEQAKRELIARVAWDAYLATPHPKWGAQHRADHVNAANEGGVLRKIGKEKTKAAPLADLLRKPLHEITAQVVQDWLENECTTRPTFAHNSFRKFRTFIRWCAKHPEFQHVVHADCCITDEVKDIIPASKTKEGDCLQREQLSEWFAAVRKIGSPVISAYLQALLITGARRGELEVLRWGDVDFKWNSMTIRDKTAGLRVIPLTPFLANLLAALPRRSEWVFSSPTAASGHITEPRIAHKQALQIAGLPHVSLHGLRRSFGTLSEWVEVPTGVVAQIQGHKPSAIAEKHYRRRPLDLLRMWHVKIEAWILEQAGIEFVPAVPGLRVVPVV